MMHLVFEAKKVTYIEALGGDIVQISFEKDITSDPINNPTLCLNISVNHEFPPFMPEVEWFDGDEYDGGETIKILRIDQKSLQVVLNNDISFDISFQIAGSKYKKIESFLLTATE